MFNSILKNEQNTEGNRLDMSIFTSSISFGYKQPKWNPLLSLSCEDLGEDKGLDLNYISDLETLVQEKLTALNVPVEEELFSFMKKEIDSSSMQMVSHAQTASVSNKVEPVTCCDSISDIVRAIDETALDLHSMRESYATEVGFFQRSEQGLILSPTLGGGDMNTLSSKAIAGEFRGDRDPDESLGCKSFYRPLVGVKAPDKSFPLLVRCGLLLLTIQWKVKEKDKIQKKMDLFLKSKMQNTASYPCQPGAKFGPRDGIGPVRDIYLERCYGTTKDIRPWWNHEFHYRLCDSKTYEDILKAVLECVLPGFTKRILGKIEKAVDNFKD